MKASDVARAMYPDYKEERACARALRRRRSGWFGQAEAEIKVPDPRAQSRVGDPDPRHQFRSAGQVRAERRRGAGRPHRRHRHAGRGHHDLSDPVAGAEGFRGEPERWLDVRWDVDETTPQRFPARILVDNVNEPGSLAQVATVIAEHDGNIDNISMSRRSPDFTELTIDLEVYDLKHLSAIIAQLRAKPSSHGSSASMGHGEEALAPSQSIHPSRDAPVREAIRAGLNSAICYVESPPPLRLGVNVDHVATLRNARAGERPDPVRAALLAIEAGADGITAHLREDRRHIRDDDMARLKAEISKPLNFEMAATADMLRIALRPSRTRCAWCPSARRAHHRGRPRRGRPAQRAGAVHRGAERCRHPGVAVHRRRPAADRDGGEAARAGDRNPHRRLVRRVVDGHAAKAEAEWQRIGEGAKLRARPAWRSMPATASIMQTAETIAALPEIVELNIGYFMIGEALFVGLGDDRRAMRAAMDRGRAPVPESAREREQGMIIGIGSDLIDIRRVAKVIERHGDRFLDRIFTDAERAKAGAPRQEREDGGGDLCQALRRQGGLFQGARHRNPARRLVARHGGGEPAGRPSDHAADRRGAGPARGADARRVTRRGSISPSPTTGRWRRPSS
jgi:pyridoxine 5-phosphate synthase